MTTEVLGNKNPMSTLDQSILNLIQDGGAGTGLEGLINFESKLTKEEKKLTPSEIILILKKMTNDIQNPDFLSFESGKRDGKDFGFEGIGVDVIPTVTPNGDCIVPVNFWRDSQRRTILLVLEVSFDGENNHYQLPAGDNHYLLHIGHEDFAYQLIDEEGTFKMVIQD
jgi:hypothetical protein